jgi:hypothetical protein
MAKFIKKKSNQNLVSTLLNEFLSLNLFTKLLVITTLLIIIAVPFFIYNSQTFRQYASGKASKFTITLLTTSPTFSETANFKVYGVSLETGSYWLHNRCTQSSVLVYEQYLKISASGDAGPFTLGPTPSWTSGQAECTASVDLFQKGRFRPQASYSYTVLP